MELACRIVEHWDDPKPGDIIYTTLYGDGTRQTAGMIFCCPCGCGGRASIAFDVPQRAPGDRLKWNWNGNKEKPTLTPSLQKTDGCKWHGFLTDGVFRSC